MGLQNGTPFVSSGGWAPLSSTSPGSVRGGWRSGVGFPKIISLTICLQAGSFRGPHRLRPKITVQFDTKDSSDWVLYG